MLYQRNHLYRKQIPDILRTKISILNSEENNNFYINRRFINQGRDSFCGYLKCDGNLADGLVASEKKGSHRAKKGIGIVDLDPMAGIGDFDKTRQREKRQGRFSLPAVQIRRVFSGEKKRR